jgi:hypothetical protein
MKLLEDLKQKFPLKEVAPYGFCIVVPGPDFDPDWEAELGDKGYKCFNTDVDGKPVTLVRVVKAEKGSGEKTVSSPPIAPIASTASTEGETFPRRWPENEEKRLLERWNQVKGTAAERSVALAPEFPGRTAQAIMLKAKKLRRERGLSRRYGKRSKKASEKASAEPVMRNTSQKTPKTLGIPSTPEAPIGPGPEHIPAKDEVVELLKQILHAIKPKEESVYFESYCPNCRKRGSAEDSNVWKACPVCGGPLIVWNVEVSA